MENRLTNGGLLDGPSGWTATPAGLSLSVDEGQRGAPGRAALKAVGTSTAGGQAFRILTSSAAAADVAGVGTVEASCAVAAFVAGVAVTPIVRLVFQDAGGAVLTAVDLVVRRPFLQRWGVGVQGLRDTYHLAWGRIPRPSAAAKALLEVGATATGSGQAIEAVLLKPLIAPAPPTEYALLWSPGRHTNIDLQLPAWPGALREIETGAGFDPKPGWVEFDAGAGRPMSRRISPDPARKLSGRMRCDVVQRGMLESFAASAAKFWFVEPGSDRLCIASWAADGAPRLAETRGGLHVMEFSIWLETA
ncbi:hypothetical protein [Brevundimonas faecalis]|uniref:Phage tail protein n=1 Tax=Brevundimonas faecalis TaxID=947378 RepID=A0ABV2RCJ8_9CAUL